jgi:hypothetical protein
MILKGAPRNPTKHYKQSIKMAISLQPNYNITTRQMLGNVLSYLVTTFLKRILVTT